LQRLTKQLRQRRQQPEEIIDQPEWEYEATNYQSSVCELGSELGTETVGSKSTVGDVGTGRTIKASIPTNHLLTNERTTASNSVRTDARSNSNSKINSTGEEKPYWTTTQVTTPRPHDENAEILKLIHEREVLRGKSVFAAADLIQEKLKVLGVQLYDKQARWSTSDGRGGAIVPGCRWSCMLSDEEIHTLVLQREAAIQDNKRGKAEQVNRFRPHSKPNP
jgi:cysteinyl-tRNA synthetase